jgi:hypothetical protein
MQSANEKPAEWNLPESVSMKAETSENAGVQSPVTMFHSGFAG